MWTVSQYFLGLLMSWLIEPAHSGPPVGPLEAVYVGLYIAPTPVLSPTNTLADITEADYTGYARQEVVWYPPYISGGGPYTLEGHSLHFQPTDAVTPNNITGVFIADAPTGGNLLMSFPCPGTGIPLGNASQAMTVDALFQMAFGSNYGAPELSN